LLTYLNAEWLHCKGPPIFVLTSANFCVFIMVIIVIEVPIVKISMHWLLCLSFEKIVRQTS
jgi:hypothetical protein